MNPGCPVFGTQYDHLVEIEVPDSTPDSFLVLLLNTYGIIAREVELATFQLHNLMSAKPSLLKLQTTVSRPFPYSLMIMIVSLVHFDFNQGCPASLQPTIPGDCPAA